MPEGGRESKQQSKSGAFYLRRSCASRSNAATGSPSGRPTRLVFGGDVHRQSAGANDLQIIRRDKHSLFNTGGPGFRLHGKPFLQGRLAVIELSETSRRRGQGLD